MARPIEATPILYGEDAKRFVEDVERVNKKLEDPIYRAKVEAELDKCRDLYNKFYARMM